MPPLFHESQQLDESELVESLSIMGSQIGRDPMMLDSKLSLSEAASFAPAMLSVVSASSQCSTKVSRSPVSGLKP